MAGYHQGMHVYFQIFPCFKMDSNYWYNFCRSMRAVGFFSAILGPKKWDAHI